MSVVAVVLIGMVLGTRAYFGSGRSEILRRANGRTSYFICLRPQPIGGDSGMPGRCGASRVVDYQVG